mmetsp:Transcript_26943/g.39895  ORF Transcript_26943/g.39895 Transcript_26943/m.39895 type:complete len:197 (+) Transcript_26943:81-671(+)
MYSLHLQFALFVMMQIIPAAHAFQPSLTRRVAIRTALESSIPQSAYSEYDPVSQLDLNHVHDCADNFGKCPIVELEDMKKALKTERIQHAALGITLDPEEEVDHRLLEEDLTLQIALLKDEVPYNPKRPVVKKPAHNNAVAAIANPDYYHHDHTLRDYVEQGEELFLMPNGLGDVFAFGAALFILAMGPLVTQHSH